MQIVALCESQVTDLVAEALSLLMCVEAAIMRFNSSVLVLDLTAHTRDIIIPKRL